MTKHQIQHRIDSGLWARIAGNGYRLSTQRPDVRLRAHAAMLTWPDVVVCTRTAALLHGAPIEDDGRVHVWSPTNRRSNHGIEPHRFTLVDDEGDIVQRGLLRITSPAQTYLDCLARLPADDAWSLLAWVVTRDRITMEQITDRLGRFPGLWGNAQLRLLLRDAARGAVSEAERRMHTILDDAGITGWEANVPVVVDGRTICNADLYFRTERVLIAVDGRRYHSADNAFQRDRTQQNQLIAAGILPLRFTWTDVTERATAVGRQVQTILEKRRRRRSA
ncbi:MAG: hypothetical protein ACTMIR_05885 [Cellulomonadaceae bacterium]